MKKCVVALIIGSGIILSVLAYSQEAPAEAVKKFKTVVVTGTRTEEAVEKIPSNITVIDEEDIENSNAKNVIDLLKSEQGIVVRDLLGNGKNAQVDMRGFGETGSYNTLVLVDGRRVNEIDLSGVDWAQIPLEQIERIEILRGTGTVLYGDSAVGGVINIITRIPDKELYFSGGMTVGSYGRNKEKASISGGTDNIRANIMASYDSTNGYRENSDFRGKDVAGKVIYDPTEALRFTLNGVYHDDSYGLPGELSADEMIPDRRVASSPLNRATAEDGYISLKGDLDLGEKGNFIADLSIRNREIFSDYIDSSSTARSELETRNFTPRYIFDGDLFSHENSFIAGIDLYTSELYGEMYWGTPLALIGLTDLERDSFGIYFNDEFSIYDKLILTLGARRERVRYDFNQINPGVPINDRLTHRENAYNIGLTYLYKEGTSFFIRINRSLRFPLTDELVGFDFVSGLLVTNKNFKPQTGDHYEAGARHQFTENLQGNVTLFRAEIKDEIFFNKPIFANQNHPETLHEGLELGLRMTPLDYLTINGNYTYTSAEFKKAPYNGNDLPGVPKHRVNVSVILTELIPDTILSANYRYTSESVLISDLDNSYNRLDSYYCIDIKASYKWKNINFFASVNNLTGEEYSEYGVIGRFPVVETYYPAPERNWTAGFEVFF